MRPAVGPEGGREKGKREDDADESRRRLIASETVELVAAWAFAVNPGRLMGVKRKKTSNRNKHGTAVEHGGPTQQGNKAFGHQCSDRAVSLADARGGVAWGGCQTKQD